MEAKSYQLHIFLCSVSQAHLVPTDEIKVYYRCQPEGDYLNSVVQAHADFIMGTIKTVLLPFPVPKTASVIISENTQVWQTDGLSQTAFCSVWLMSEILSMPFKIFCFSSRKLKNSDLELTIVKGSSAQASLNGPACTYVNMRVSVNNKEKGRWRNRSLQSTNMSDGIFNGTG